MRTVRRCGISVLLVIITFFCFSELAEAQKIVRRVAVLPQIGGDFSESSGLIEKKFLSLLFAEVDQQESWQRTKAVGLEQCELDVDCLRASFVREDEADVLLNLQVFSGGLTLSKWKRLRLVAIDSQTTVHELARANGTKIEDAISQLVDESLLLRQKRPILEVVGASKDSRVVIDGVAVGALPVRYAVLPGRHFLQVYDAGEKVITEQSVDVEMGAPTTIYVDVKKVGILAPPIESADAAPKIIESVEPELNTSRIWLGSGLIAAAAALAIWPSYRLAKYGSCRDTNVFNGDVICTAQYGFGWPEALTFVASGLALVSGIAVFVWPDDDDQSVAMKFSWQGKF